MRIAAGRHGVQVDAWNAQTQTIERWRCDRCIVALPGFVAARVIEHPPELLRKLAERIRYAPWAVVNLHLHRPLADRPGAPPPGTTWATARRGWATWTRNTRAWIRVRSNGAQLVLCAGRGRTPGAALAQLAGVGQRSAGRVRYRGHAAGRSAGFRAQRLGRLLDLRGSLYGRAPSGHWHLTEWLFMAYNAP
jgi:hypothetical protein